MSRKNNALPFLMLWVLWSFLGLAQSSNADTPLTRLDCFASGDDLPVEILYAEAGLPVEVIAQRDPDQWQFLREGAVRPVGLDTSAWVRFAVSHEGMRDQQWWVTLRWPSLDHVQMYVLSPEGELRWSSRPVGEDYPLEHRYKSHRHFLFPLDLEVGETAVVYLEVRSNKLSVVPVEIWEDADFVENDQLHLVILGAVFGALAVMFFYNLSLYAILLDRVYLYYCAYVAGVFAFLLAMSGLGVYYLWDGSLWLKDKGGTFFASVSFVSTALFIRYFLALPYYRGWVLHVNNFFVLLWAGIALLSLVLPTTPTFLGVINLVSLLSSVASTATGCYLWWFRRSNSAKIFIFAWTFLNVGTVLSVLSLQGILPLNVFTIYAQMAGIVVELAIISFALAHRINEAKLAQARADQEALRLTQQISEERAQRLKAQIETLEAQKKLNEELEIRVQQRTEQLNETMLKLEQANDELRQLSTTDPLTEVHNRRYLDEVLAVECKRANRTGQHLALVMLDIDHFKPVNDRYGHTVGDKCLRAVADALKDVVKRPGDLLARYGGEEFVLVLPNTDEAQALQVAEKSRAAVAALKLDHEGEPLPLTISAGVAAVIPSGEETPAFLLKAADRALYRAKDDGRNRVVAASQLVPDPLNS